MKRCRLVPPETHLFSTSLHHIHIHCLLLSAKMASRYRSFSKPAFSIFNSAFNKPKSSFLGLGSSLRPTRRRISQLGSLQSLLPLHSAVSSARLTSCLGIDSRISMLSQGMLSADPGSLASMYRDRIMRKRNLIRDEIHN